MSAADYLPADAYLNPATGPSISEESVDVDMLQDVLDALDSVDRPDWGDGDGVPVAADGSSLRLPPMDLPGFGSEREDCGDDMPLFCTDCGHVEIVGRTCRQASCPRCGAAWVRDRAINVCARLIASRAALDAVEDSHQRFHHLAISPPADWAVDSDDPVGETFQAIYDMLDAMGLQGYVFYHPFAGQNDPGEDDRGKWKDRLFSGRDWVDVRQELQIRPHFHVVAIGHRVPGGRFTTEFHDRSGGWILKRITGEDSRVSIYDNDDLARVVTYCISHTGLSMSETGQRVQYRPFGEAVNPAHGVDVQERTRREADRKVRAAAPKTLGLDLGSQLCQTTREKVVETPSVRASLIAGAADGDGETGDSTTSATSTGDGTDVEQDDDAPDPDDVETETAPCEGRMLSIKRAPDYLGDLDWRSEAEHVDDLQTTWDDWADRLDDLPDAPAD